jgi:hypothetical protein
MRSVKRCCEGCVVSPTPAGGKALRFASVFDQIRPQGAVEFFAL